MQHIRILIGGLSIVAAAFFVVARSEGKIELPTIRVIQTNDRSFLQAVVETPPGTVHSTRRGVQIVELHVYDRSSMKRFIVLCALGAACSRSSGDASKTPGTLDAAIAATCGSPSKPVPFTKVDLGPARTRAAKQDVDWKELIQSEEEWKQRWPSYDDSLPAPTLNFKDSVVLVVASPMFKTGPSTMEIEGAGRCVGTQDIVVPVRRHTASTSNQPERSLRAIEISRDDWQQQRITFIDVPAVNK